MDIPTADALRARSSYLTQRYPADSTPGGVNDTVLTTWAEDLAPLLTSLTCRTFGESTGEADVPDGMVGLATRVLAMMIERAVIHRGSFRETKRTVGADGIQSFTAGAYSESRYALDAAMKAQALDPNPELAQMLWALATDSCRAAWLALWNNELPPAAVLQSFEYADRPGSYYGAWGTWLGGY